MLGRVYENLRLSFLFWRLYKYYYFLSKNMNSFATQFEPEVLPTKQLYVSVDLSIWVRSTVRLGVFSQFGEIRGNSSLFVARSYHTMNFSSLRGPLFENAITMLNMIAHLTPDARPQRVINKGRSNWKQTFK